MVRQRRRRRSPIGEDFLRWLGFTVLASLFPLGLHFMFLRAKTPLATTFWSTVQTTLASGDLFLVTFCIGSAAIGERFARTPIRPHIELILGLTCLISTAASVFFYALTFIGALHSTVAVATLSCALLIMTVLSSAGIMFITLQERRR